MSVLPDLSRRSLIAAFPIALVALSGAAGISWAASGKDGLPEMVVYKTPTCGCCTAWVAHIRKAGFPVRVVEVEDTGSIEARYNVPENLRSCHIGIVQGYAVEGHVPAREIHRLLAERPSIAGLAVPGMPAGSPGMEMGERRDPYGVFAFTRDGKARLFARY